MAASLRSTGEAEGLELAGKLAIERGDGIASCRGRDADDHTVGQAWYGIGPEVEQESPWAFVDELHSGEGGQSADHRREALGHCSVLALQDIGDFEDDRLRDDGSDLAVFGAPQQRPRSVVLRRVPIDEERYSVFVEELVRGCAYFRAGLPPPWQGW